MRGQGVQYDSGVITAVTVTGAPAGTTYSCAPAGLAASGSQLQV
ncbi:hypothetical protein [Azospirillum halopraeferens]|nr:hypothetical protein [Azospirillum halopraeferens]